MTCAGGSPGLVVTGWDLNLKVVGLNPSTVYRMDIISHKIAMFAWKRRKRGRGWPIKNIDSCKASTLKMPQPIPATIDCNYTERSHHLCIVGYSPIVATCTFHFATSGMWTLQKENFSSCSVLFCLKVSSKCFCCSWK